MTRLVKLVNHGDYRAAITEAYSGRYGVEDFAGGSAPGAKDVISSRVVMGQEYNVARAISSMHRDYARASIARKAKPGSFVGRNYAAWLLWCYTEPESQSYADALYLSAYETLIDQIDRVEYDCMRGFAQVGQALKLLGGVMENHREHHRNGRTVHSLQKMAESLGLSSHASVCGDKKWGRVRAGFERGVQNLDCDAVNVLMQKLESYKQMAAA